MHKTKIIIVEDESIIALDIKKTLEGLGYDVLCIVNNGNEAILNAEKLKPDIMLMDIQLKGDMDGIEAAWQIRSKFDVPVVYLTSYAYDITLERAKRTEPLGYMVKPFDDVSLKITLMMACHKAEIEKKLKLVTAKLEKSNKELQEAIDNIKVLSGFLPICAWCKKIRDDKGYWNQVEKYISEHSELKLTHGICPECFKKEQNR